MEQNEKKLKARLNQKSLQKMAIRHIKTLHANPARSQATTLLKKALHYLKNCLDADLSDEVLVQIENDLETIEEAIKQQRLTRPLNEALYLPNHLNKSQLATITQIIEKAKKAARHLSLISPTEAA